MYIESEPVLLAGYEGMKQRESSILTEGADRIAGALDRLISLYGALDYPDKVQQYRELREAYPTVVPDN